MAVFRSAIAIAMSCLTVLASAQSVQDLSKDPRLQQTVDIHLKRVLLPELTAYLKKHTDQKFAIAKDIEPLMVCVFVEKQPLWKVMQDVADVLGCEWRDLRSEWRLAPDPLFAKELGVYGQQEKEVLASDVRQKAIALTEYVSRERWLGQASSGGEQAEPDDETPAAWAERVARQGPYYVAGIMFRNDMGESQTAAAALRQTFDSDVFKFDWPAAFKLVNPPTKDIAKWQDCGLGPDVESSLVNSQVAVRTVQWAGTIQSVAVDSGSHRAAKPKYLLRYPKPVGGLAKGKQGQSLLSWESSLDKASDPAMEAPTGQMSLKPSEFDGGLRGIEDYLEVLFDNTKIPIVCDGFRMPTIGEKPPLEAASIRDWLNQVRTSQKCFVKVANGDIAIRHGGFWDLRSLEPPEESLREFERVPKPDLNDYADFAVSMMFTMMQDADSQGIPFFDSKQIPLTRFNSKPLRDSLFTLLAYGQMSKAKRAEVLTGGYFNSVLTSYQEGHWQSDYLYGLDQKRRPAVITFSHLVGPTVTGQEIHDLFLSHSAAIGIFYGGTPIGKENLMLEDFSFPTSYLKLWGQSPDQDPDFVAKYGNTGDLHAHYLFLKSGPSGGASTGSGEPRSLYGRFSFLAGISDMDGVLNEVEIPGGN